MRLLPKCVETKKLTSSRDETKATTDFTAERFAPRNSALYCVVCGVDGCRITYIKIREGTQVSWTTVAREPLGTPSLFAIAKFQNSSQIADIKLPTLLKLETGR